MVYRAKKAAKLYLIKATSRVQVKGEQNAHNIVGYPIENVKPGELSGPARTKAERGDAKIVNVYNPARKTWGQLNSANWETFSSRLKSGQITRNTTAQFLGWSWQQHEPLGGGAPAPLGGGAPAPLGGGAPAPIGGGAPAPIAPFKVNIVTAGSTLFLRWFQSRGMVPPQVAQEAADKHWRSNTGGEQIGRVVQFIQESVEGKKCSLDYMCVYDTCPFNDPDRRGGINHLGMNKIVLDQISNHRRFPTFWIRMVKEISSMLRDRMQLGHQSDVVPTFVFYCRKGRHRSVACATFLCELLRDRGWQVEMTHLMREYWRFETCDECDMCKTRDDEKKTILRRPWQWLNALPPALEP
jgi:hypothetical protein